MIAARARFPTTQTMINDQGPDAPPLTMHELASAAYNSRALMNLAYWVFGEDAYVLPDTASSVGTVLPHTGWIFASSSGLVASSPTANNSELPAPSS